MAQTELLIKDLLGPKPAEDWTVESLLGARPSETSGPRIPGMIASALAKGVVGMAGTPGNIEAAGQKYLPSWMTRSPDWWPTGGLGQFIGLPANNEGRLFPTSTELLAKTAPVTDNPKLKPRNRVERFASSAATGVGAALPLLLTGGAALPMLAAGALGGLGAEAGHELMPDNEWAPIVGGLVGGGLGQMTLGGISQASKDLARKMLFEEKLFGGLGGIGGGVIAHQIGMDTLFGTELGAAIGVATPLAFRGAKSMVTRPSGPLAGFVAGQQVEP